MIEKIFFEEWPWWVFGIIAFISAAVAIWASYKLPDSPQPILSEETVIEMEKLKLERRKNLFDFVSNNSFLFYMAIAYLILFVLWPLAKG